MMIDHYTDDLYINLASAHFELVMLPYWACASGSNAGDWYGRIIARPVNELAHTVECPYDPNHGFLHSDYELITEENIQVYIPKEDFSKAYHILEKAAKANLRYLKKV